MWQASARKGVLSRCGLLLLIALLTGCAQFVPQTIALRTDWPADVPLVRELREVPFFPQREYQCGPAALAIAMNTAGASIHPDDLVADVYLPARNGSLQVEMLAAPRRHGLVGWQIPATYPALLRELASGRPVLVLQDLGVWPLSNWHYAVVVGYDYESGELYLRSGENRRLALPFTLFEVTWKRSGYWAMVVTSPGTIPTTATEANALQTLLAFEHRASPTQSRMAWQGFLSRWPGNPLAGLALGNQHYAARELDLAEAVLRRTLDTNPGSEVVLNNLAQVLSDQGRNEDALVLINQAASLKGPFHAQVTATRAGILLRLGR